MVKFDVLIDVDAQEFLDHLPKKTQTNVKNKLRVLEEDPFSGADKELLNPKHKKLYRLHISRNYTAFYRIFSEERTVKILWLGSIEQAHNLYGRFNR